ncbi:MAG TPA: DUF3261 domain-containing protein [Rhodanobacteraceae bacterium]
MKPSRLLLPLLFVVLGAGCAGLPMTRPDCVAIGPAGAVCPLPPAQLPALSARHVVTVTHAGQSHTFLGRLHIGRDALRLAGASLFGTHLFTLTWDGHAVSMQPIQSKLRPKLMLVMLEMALADPAALKPRLHGLVLKLSGTADDEVRALYEHGHLVARVERRGASLASAHVVMSIPPAKLVLRLAPLDGAH